MTDENENLVIEATICKSISGEEDENGNYKFEVEASNENLDLQNQITLQSALEKSQEYFITNGVISDDHLHKTRNPDGSVETHKDKIIGEPISVRFDKDTKKTFVKGILYAGIESAKPYIDLLKNKSRLVKASIGGIMPKIKHNNDGTETVTSFMWNDLALTCSPVNWTVGSAKFAKSVSMVDFCKSLEAGSGTDASKFEGGRALQDEDLEKETVKIQDITDGKLDDDKETESIEKSMDDIIFDAIRFIDMGDLKTQEEIENYFILNGLSADTSKELALEIIKQGGTKMKKSNFSSTIDELLKSFGGKKDAKDAKEELDSEDDEVVEDKLDFEDDEDSEEDDDDEKPAEPVKKCVKKSFDEEDSENDDYIDATDLMKSMCEKVDELTAENESLKKSLEEVQNNMLEVTKSFSDYLKTPEKRQSVMQKSMTADNNVVSNGPAKAPSTQDFDLLKSCLVKACSKGDVTLEEVQFYNSEFQKSMKGMKVNPTVWKKICSIVKDNK